MRSVLATLTALALTAGMPAAATAQNLTASDQDKEAVRQAAYDYAEGYYQGAVDRMERALHPLLTKRGLMARGGGPAVLVPMNADTSNALFTLRRRCGRSAPGQPGACSFGRAPGK
jgi:hypothetical protein